VSTAGPPSRPAWRTWANGLTLLRLLSALPFAAAVALGQTAAAALLFGVAVATDYADGPLARRRGEASPLGGLLDHATDAAFVSLGLGALACRDVVPAALPVLVPLAFVQYALDSRALAGAPLRASGLGRWNGILYFVPLGAAVIRDALGLGWPADGLLRAIGWVLVASTVVSMLDRALALIARSRSPR